MSGAWLGRLLRGLRAGEDKLLCRRPRLAALPRTLALRSEAFRDGEVMQARHAGRGVGANVSPALSWSGAPTEAVELALVVEDADVPLPRPFVHLCAHGIDPARPGFAEGALQPGGLPDVAFGRNTAGPPSYAGPRALPGHGPHHYVFQLYALRSRVGLPPGSAFTAVFDRIEALAIVRGELTGVFEQTR